MNGILYAIRKLSNGCIRVATEDGMRTGDRVYCHPCESGIVVTREKYHVGCPFSLETKVVRYDRSAMLRLPMQYLRDHTDFAVGDYIAFRKLKDGQIFLSKATPDEILKYSEPKHESAVSGRIRCGRFIYFTKEEKVRLGIRRGDAVRVTIDMTGKPVITIRKLFKKEKNMDNLQTQIYALGDEEFYSEPREYKNVYLNNISIPAAFLKEVKLDENQCLKVSFQGRKMILTGQDRYCDVCGSKISGKRYKKHVCTDCNEQLDSVNRFMEDGKRNHDKAAQISKKQLETLLTEMDARVELVRERAKKLLQNMEEN